MLPQPNHVILNHLYALSIKVCMCWYFSCSHGDADDVVVQDNVLVLAATHRYKEKYVTILTYKPVLL